MTDKQIFGLNPDASFEAPPAVADDRFVSGGSKDMLADPEAVSVLEKCMAQEDDIYQVASEKMEQQAIEEHATRGPTLEFTVATKERMAALSPERKLALLKKAKSGTWYDDWKPYCGTCSTMARMVQEDYGFTCKRCGNMIGWDLTRLKESPLNSMSAEQLANLQKQEVDAYRIAMASIVASGMSKSLKV